jgi:diguanylate cyclase (GGDEF)-like protein
VTSTAAVPSSAAAALTARLADVHERWLELCTWDPELPPDTTVRHGEDLLVAVADALDRPQPLGWGIDPALVGPVEVLSSGLAPEVAAAQLVCLREALHLHVTDAVGDAIRRETGRRIDMIVDRLMAHAVRETTHHLRTMAYVDPLTGLPNRRAFDTDLNREKSRARRHHHVLSVAVLDLDGLKATNDAHGHDAGDELLRTVALLLRSALRHEDVAYRIGGDEFAVLLPDIDVADEHFLCERLSSVGAPPVSIGVASSNRDPIDDLFRVADERLYAGRAARRGTDGA